MSSRLFHILLFRAASTIGANIYEIIGENIGKLIGVAAEVSGSTLRFKCQNQVGDGILSWCLSREYYKREKERCLHAAQAPNGMRLSCGATLECSQTKDYLKKTGAVSFRRLLGGAMKRSTWSLKSLISRLPASSLSACGS